MPSPHNKKPHERYPCGFFLTIGSCVESVKKSFALAIALKEEDAERAGFKPAPTKGAIAFHTFDS
jgi:DNA-binding transcriptional regulator WhiA